MLTDAAVAVAPKKARRQVSKSTARQVEKTTKTAVYLSDEAMKKLGLTSLMERRSQSDIIDELVRLHLRKYVVAVRDRSALEDSAGQLTQEVSAAA